MYVFGEGVVCIDDVFVVDGGFIGVGVEGMIDCCVGVCWSIIGF